MNILIVTYGITAIIIDSELFRPIRALLTHLRLGKLVTCYLCLGFWAGMGVSWMAGERVPPSLLMDAAAASGFCYAINALVKRHASPGPPLAKGPVWSESNQHHF